VSEVIFTAGCGRAVRFLRHDIRVPGLTLTPLATRTCLHDDGPPAGDELGPAAARG